ncbi:histone-lysine N-methyltransferase SETMAR [Elysia marginata]|uniref:Histone-lysine N-methyltransferase SETMAR n=1 Tax=Elysia marginata TaxID=1093978 RepID=A0AAV4GDK4_9GAST|nr:histone-lysine N-methyltransferase SETMAR [Elysia marginata]
MGAHLETWSKEEIRVVICFLNAKSLNPTEIHKDLQSVYGEHVISRSQVYHWCNLFETGHSDLTDREGRGRSITATSEDNVNRVDELIRQDRRLKLHEIASSFEISETSAHRIVFDELGYRKVSARWVPKQLTDIHKEQRLDTCRELLRRSKSSCRVHGHTANAGGDFLGYDVTFLGSIFTGDETWLHHCTPETKQDSMTWKHPSSPVTKKVSHADSKENNGNCFLGQSWCSSVRNLTTWRNNQCCKVLPNS